jgi:hypothetical protein
MFPVQHTIATRQSLWRSISTLVLLVSYFASFNSLNAQTPDDLSMRYFVVIERKLKKTDAQASAAKLKNLSPVVIRSDDFSGLEPGGYLIVYSYHITKRGAETDVAYLKTRGIEATVSYSGRRIEEIIPDLLQAREALCRFELIPADAQIELETTIFARGRAFPLIAASHPVDDVVNPYLPYDKDYVLKLFIFLGQKPIVIPKHLFLKPTYPADQIWEIISCGELRKFPLGQEGDQVPIVLAQNCRYQGQSLYHYAIFDHCRLVDPETGTAVWSHSASLEAPHQVFVPNDDPRNPAGISPRKGDGVTVLEGVEGRRIQGKAHKYDKYEMRRYRLVWRNGSLRHEYGDWENLPE